MAKVLISEKYLYDIANAIRVKLDSQSTYTPAQMAAAIEDITGSIAGSITPSTVTSKKLVTESYLTAIGNAIRAKLDVATLYTPAQMADAILSIAAPTPVVEIVSWANGTDAELGAMIDAAHAGTIDLQQDGGWSVGDVRTISIEAFTGGGNVLHAAQNIDIVITTFDEYESCGNVLQFDFLNSLATPQRMNDTDTNVGGYGSSEMKTTTLPALVNALPQWLKNRLITFSTPTSQGDQSSIIESVGNNKLALRSEYEIRGSVSNSYSEGERVSYYNTSDRYKKKLGNTGNYNEYWCRSPRRGYSNGFASVTSSGRSSGNSATWTCGIAPFGCL